MMVLKLNFLDENLMPYTVENGELTTITLPLEHLKVTDPTLVSKINSTNSLINSRAVYYGGDVNSGEFYTLTQPLSVNSARKSTIEIYNIASLFTCTFEINFFYSYDNGASWYAVINSRKSGNYISDDVNLNYYNGVNKIIYSITSINRTPAYKYKITLS